MTIIPAPVVNPTTTTQSPFQSTGQFIFVKDFSGTTQALAGSTPVTVNFKVGQVVNAQIVPNTSGSSEPPHYALVNTPRGAVMVAFGGRQKILDPYVETTKPPVLEMDQEPEEISESIPVSSSPAPILSGKSSIDGLNYQNIIIGLLAIAGIFFLYQQVKSKK